MRNTLALLSLLALAAAANATETGQGSAQATISYTLGADLTASLSAYSRNLTNGDDGLPRAAGRYVYDLNTGDYSHQAPPQVADAETGDVITDPNLYALSLSGDGTGSVSGNALSVSASMSASLTGSTGHDLYLDGVYGYRYFLEVTNNSLTDPEEVVFDYQSQSLAISGTIDRPDNASTNEGPEVFANAVAQVFDTSVDPTLDQLISDDTFPSNQPFSDTASFTGAQRRFTLAPGATGEYDVYASVRVFNEDDRKPLPVPEPSALAALGLGALALLRRRDRR